jgi:hypothetical protein
LERTIEEGDNPVYDNFSIMKKSRAGHEKSCLNMGGPSSKAKYSWETDSELVPWGKGEKYSKKEGEKDPETVCLQAVGALCLSKGDGMPFA